MKLKLSHREKRELFFVGVFTATLLIISDVALYILADEWMRQNPGLENGIFQVEMSLTLGPNNIQVGNWGVLFVFIILIIDAFVVYLRVIYRYHQIQLLHVITELHFIASGHFNHRIPFKLSGQMQRVVESINTLVDSTIEAMREEKEMEKSKDELITNVSHDIRTPLTSIIGYLGLIENKQFHSEEDVLKFVHIAYLKANQMKSMVSDLFEYAKVHQQDTPMNLVEVPLKSLFEQLKTSFQLEAHQQGMKIEVEDLSEDLKLEADPEKFIRIFNNLITNALKYAQGGKHIFLSAKKIENNQVEIQVANDGEAIPENALPQVFDRFYRVEKSRNSKTGGTGLGLAITQQIVAMHHGTIKVKSNDERTSFVMDFPVKQPVKNEQVKE